jgi:hypothetical protein
MACNTIDARLEPCKEYLGGIQGMFLIPFTFSDVITVDGTGAVSKIAESGGVTLKTGYFWELKGLSTLEIGGAVSRDNGNTTYTQTLTLSLKPSGNTPALNESDREIFESLDKGRWRVVAWDRNNVFTLLGENEGLDATTDVKSWGTQMGDANLYTVTLVGMEKNSKAIVDAETYSDMSTVVTVID